MNEYVISKMIDYFHYDVQRINHALKVFSFARIISMKELLDDQTKQIIDLSAILHDIGIKEAERKYNSSAGHYQEKEGPPVARRILTEFNIPENIIERVCFIIANHHTYDKIDGLDFRILVEADFIVNIFEENFSKDKVEKIYDKYFRTDTGKNLIRTMYLD
jgi:HD superfamily phosphodiesterase